MIQQQFARVKAENIEPLLGSGSVLALIERVTGSKLRTGFF